MEGYITGPDLDDPAEARDIMNRLYNMDATRTMHLLRSLGLITRSPGEMFQLAPGAASGVKDIRYAHKMPCATVERTPDGEVLTLTMTEEPAADIIVNDLDPRYGELYAQYAKDTPHIRGYIADTSGVLELLATENLPERNLVTMIRIEPAMILEAAAFLAGPDRSVASTPS